MIVSPLLAAGLFLTLGQLQWEAGLNAQGRVMREAARDLQLEPAVGLTDASRDVLLRARYDPRLLFRMPDTRGSFDALHRGELSAAFRLDRDTSLVLTETGSIGSNDFSWLSLAPETAPPVNVQGNRAATLSTVDQRSSITISQRFSNRLSGSVTGAFRFSGALDTSELGALPRTYAPQLGIAGVWTASSDVYSAGLDGSYGWISGGHVTQYAGAFASWRHAFSGASRHALTASVVELQDPSLGPRYESELRAGFAAFGGNDPAQQHGVAPTAALSLYREAPRRPGALAARVTLRYAPTLDPTTGAFVPRGELSGILDLRLHRYFSGNLAGGYAYTPDPVAPYPRSVAQGALGLTWEPVPGVAFSAGVRVARLPQTEWAGVVTTVLTQRGRL